MKTFLSALVVVALCAGGAFAGQGSQTKVSTDFSTFFRCAGKNGPVVQTDIDNLGLTFNSDFGLGYSADALLHRGLFVRRAGQEVLLQLGSQAPIRLGVLEDVPVSCTADGSEESARIKLDPAVSVASAATPDTSSCRQLSARSWKREAVIETAIVSGSFQARLTSRWWEKRFFGSLKECRQAPVSRCLLNGRGSKPDLCYP